VERHHLAEKAIKVGHTPPAYQEDRHRKKRDWREFDSEDESGEGSEDYNHDGNYDDEDEAYNDYKSRTHHEYRHSRGSGEDSDVSHKEDNDDEENDKILNAA
jgi:hypothetical protein